MVREAQEEIGIIIKQADLKLVHVMQHSSESQKHYIDFYFQADQYQGDPLNCEPEKCGDVRFFPVNELPENLVGNVRQALENIKKKCPYSEYGF